MMKRSDCDCQDLKIQKPCKCQGLKINLKELSRLKDQPKAKNLGSPKSRFSYKMFRSEAGSGQGLP